MPVPLPTQFGGTVEVDFATQKKADHGHNMMEFDIKTSTEAAIQMLKAKQADASQAQQQNDDIQPEPQGFGQQQHDFGALDFGNPQQSPNQNGGFGLEDFGQNQWGLPQGLSASAGLGITPAQDAFGASGFQFGGEVDLGQDPEDEQRRRALQAREQAAMQALHQRSVRVQLTTDGRVGSQEQTQSRRQGKAADTAAGPKASFGLQIGKDGIPNRPYTSGWVVGIDSAKRRTLLGRL